MKYLEMLRSELLYRLDPERELSDPEILRTIDQLISEKGREYLLTLQEKEALRKDLFYSVRKLDVIQELVEDEEVTEIMVNGPDRIFVERHGRIGPFGKAFYSLERLEDVIQQIAGRCNRVVNEGSPILDARLKDGARVNIVLPPVSLSGPILTIRRFPKEPISMEQLVCWGTLSREAASFLGRLVASGYSILVGGGTSTGKTTFLNALSAFIPSEERIVTIEDTAELQIGTLPNLVRLEAKTANQDGGRDITIRDLIRTALRMRPNRIIVGEVRSGEAVDYLTCLNTGHSGSLGSAHANSVRDMISRLEAMVLMGADLPLPAIRRQIASGIEILVHLVRLPGGQRVVQEVAEIAGLEEDRIHVRTLYLRNENGFLEKKEELLHDRKFKGIY